MRSSDVVLVDGAAPYYRIRIRNEFSKTKGRNVQMFWSESCDIIPEWLKSKVENTGLEEQFFDGTYGGVRKCYLNWGREQT